MTKPVFGGLQPGKDSTPGIKFNIFDSLLKLASDIIFHLLNLTVNLLFSSVNLNKMFPGEHMYT